MKRAALVASALLFASTAQAMISLKLERWYAEGNYATVIFTVENTETSTKRVVVQCVAFSGTRRVAVDDRSYTMASREFLTDEMLIYLAGADVTQMECSAQIKRPF